MSKVSASIRAPSDAVTELVITTAPAPSLKRPPHARVIRNVFPPGSWAAGGNAAIIEYHYLRAAAGYCRMCPAKRGRYKHRCDACQAKERDRWRAKQAAYNAARPPPLRTVKRGKRRSKYRYAAIKWLRLRRKQHAGTVG